MSELVDTLISQTAKGAIRWLSSDLPGGYVYMGKSGGVMVRGAGQSLSGAAFGVSVHALNNVGDIVESYPQPGETATDSRLEQLADAIRHTQIDGNPLIDALRAEIASA